MKNKIKKCFIFLLLFLILCNNCFSYKHKRKSYRHRKKSYQNIIKYFNKNNGYVLWHGSRDKKEVALTFDDGPNPPYTNKILDVLKKYNVKATFFVIGKYAERHPHLIKRIFEEGHSIGNHTFTHKSIMRYSRKRAFYEIGTTYLLIRKWKKNTPLIFRPPYGEFNPMVYNIAEYFGYHIILWDSDGYDWTHLKAKSIVYYVFRKLKKGSIILLHDGGGDRNETVIAVSTIIETLKKKGFKFVTIPELFIKQEYLPDNIKGRTYYYEPSDQGYEIKIKERIKKLKNK